MAEKYIDVPNTSLVNILKTLATCTVILETQSLILSKLNQSDSEEERKRLISLVETRQEEILANMKKSLED